MDKEAAKKAISELVEKYKRLEQDGRLTHYNEEMTKNEFIEPLFEALGWDVRNRKVYDEVIKEQGVLRGRVDYALRLNGVDRLFIEAKPFRADMNNNAWAKQVIEYGYNKGVAFVILTNFEILRVFNSEWNELNIARCIVLDLKYTDYLDKFDELSCLSREATEQNLLVEKAKTQGKKNPRKSVQELLSEQLILWRERLAKNIKSNYGEKYSQETVDEIAQKFIDRLIFIRTCEERDLEGRKLLENMNQFTKSNRRLWGLVKEVYVYYRKEYDSNLFGKDDNDLHELDRIDINDNVAYEIINSTYKKDDFDVSYNFGDIDADVLGSAYEQYLGHLLKTTAKRAKTEDGHAHRKEQGIYYTPRYIVDYIVRNTIGEKIKDMKPEEVEKLCILDPACGSGSFLIRAFDEIHNYYLLKEKNRQIKLGEESDLKQKTRILKNNIYGVDLDGKAVEIAQLNLMLKAAEKRHRLPLLQDNIKHGNSLIDDPTVAGDNAFKWDEKFTDIMKEGGFDIVIGNPPYVDIKQLEPDIVRYLFEKYPSVENRMNLYSTFVEKSLSLLKDGGYFGFIIPNSILYNESYEKIRTLLLNSTKLKKIVRLPDNIFADAKVETIILIYQKNQTKNRKMLRHECKVLIYAQDDKIDAINENKCLVKLFDQNEWNIGQRIINITSSAESTELINKIESDSKQLIELCDFSLGLTPYDKYRGHTVKQIEDRVFHSSSKKDNTFKPLLSGENITRYCILWSNGEYISYGKWLGAAREERFFKNPRIIIRQIISGIPPRIYAGYTDEELYNTQIAFSILKKDNEKISLKYILAVINSKLMCFYHKEKYLDKSKILFQKILIANAKRFPIKIVNENERKNIDEIVDRMIALKHQSVKLGDQQTNARRELEEEIKKTDAQIDERVYKIYGITEEERKTIEESLNHKKN